MRRPRLLLVLLATALSACGREDSLREGRRSGPAVPAAAETARCGGCHAHEVEAWSSSAHARHGTAVADPPGGADAAVGSSWMQAYLRRDAQGVHRIAMDCWDLREKRWRPVPPVLAEIAGSRAGLGPRTLPPVSSRSFDADCSGCHSSGARVRFDTLASRLVTTWRDLAIDCDACHGDPAPHRDGAPGTIARLPALTPRGQVMVCGRCHGGPPSDGDLPPAEADGVVALVTDHPGLFPDGSSGAQNYQVASFVRSPCFEKGGLTCTTCHDPHGRGLKGAGSADDLCLSCHAGFAGREHTHHDPAGEGARCVSCHMPRLLDGLLRHQREHRIGVPVPGIPNARDACTACHQKDDAREIASAWASWYGARPSAAVAATREGAEAVRLAREGVPEAKDALRRVATSRDPFFRAVATTYLHEPLLVRDDPSPEVRLAGVRGARPDARHEDLEPFLRDAMPRIRAEAAVALASRGDDAGRPFRADVERMARQVRDHIPARWVLAAWCLDDGRPADALPWLEQALAFDPRSPDVWFVLAEVHRARRRPAAFETSVREGVRLAAEASARGEPSEVALQRFVAIQIQRGRRPLAQAILDEAAQQMPAELQRNRFNDMAERLRQTR